MGPDQRLSPEVLLNGYRRGIFPMADSRQSETLRWIEPRRRGIMPLDRFHISRSLSRAIRRGDYAITINRAFRDVLTACADRHETWINPSLECLYEGLYARGNAHSLEVWRERELIGGVFGVSLGGAFFGETMFSRATDASKIALAYLVHRLRNGGFRLFDVQFLTPHLASLGAIEIPQSSYRGLLADALGHDADFLSPLSPHSCELVGAAPAAGVSGTMHLMTHTS